MKTNHLNAVISAVGSYVPDEVLTNTMLENMVDTNDGWITTRTGIKERRILKDKKKGTSFLGIKAAENLIHTNSIDPEMIDLIICATATPDMRLASTGAYIATQLGAVNAFAYDLQSACSGFLYGMSTAARYIESGHYKKVLLIGADKMSSVIDYHDRTTSIIFGDGAGAALFEPDESDLGVQDEIFRVDGSGREHLNIEAGGSLLPLSKENIEEGRQFLRQNGRTVFKNAVSKMSEVSQQLIKRNQINTDEIDWLVPHQANKKIIDAIVYKLNLDPSKVMLNLEKYGNTTSATLPLVLADFEKELKKGDNLIFTSFGAQFTWGALYLKWAYNA